MKELFPAIGKWVEEDKPFALATVVQTWGSSPRPVGSVMAVSGDLEMAGSVSGGCVEGAVLREVGAVLATGRPKRLAFGVSDEDAWSVGLSCGGKIQVFLERAMAFDENMQEREVWKGLIDCLENNRACVLLSELSEERGRHLLVLPDGSSTGPGPDEGLAELALRAYRERKNQVLETAGKAYFAQVFPRKSQMLIIGAAHITADLVSLSRRFDFETIVIDPRGIFAGKTEFTDPPDQIYEKYPAEVLEDFTLDEYTYAVLLSHDPKIDDQALQLLLRSGVGYIGALGSKRTHEKRKKRLEKAGFSEEEIARIHAPVGVDINAKRPNEIALSIMGEIIKVKNEFL